MKGFVVKTSFLLAVLLIVNLVQPLYGLYRLKKLYPGLALGAVKKISADSRKSKHFLVIGCSNVQHNIECKTVQDSLMEGVDFLYFEGSQNSTFLQFLMESDLTRGYKKVILYAPYHVIKKNTLPNMVKATYHFFGSFDYVLCNLALHPLTVFYNWNTFCDSIATYRTPHARGYNVINKDLLMDSLNQMNTAYFNCTAKFIHDKHIVYLPQYQKEDVTLVKGLAKGKQEVFLLFPPLPNISENITSLAASNVGRIGFDNILNKPHVVDSSLFYDQWYHLNKCGSRIETKKMIQILRTLQD